MNESLPSHFALISLLLSLVIGLAVALVAWLLSRAVAAMPPDDRAYKDPPPLGFRLLWWPITWVAHFLEPWLQAAGQASLALKLRQAGLDYCLSPPQFTAGRWVGAALGTGLALWVQGSFESAHASANSRSIWIGAVGALLGWGYPGIWLKDRLEARRTELLRQLPFYLDILTLCVEAGLNLQGAMTQAVQKGPPGVLRDELQRVLRDVRAGKGRATALRDLAERLDEPVVGLFVTAVVQAEALGMNLGPVLRAQAEQRRSERFLRAEKLAMEAPVKMLLPLIAFIFPCTFIVLFFPIAMKFMHSGF